jgi:hypothetical protein
MKQITIRLNEDNISFIRSIQEESDIQSLSLNQILNTIITAKRKERNFENTTSEDNQFIEVLEL